MTVVSVSESETRQETCSEITRVPESFFRINLLCHFVVITSIPVEYIMFTRSKPRDRIMVQ